MIADHFGWWGVGDAVAARATTEEFARDSFENVLFSLCRFAEVASRYPRRLTVVSFGFKRARFERLHAPSIRWPADAFSYVPMDPLANNPRSRFDLRAAERGERATIAPFESDPFGCGEVLSKKRRARDPFRRTPPYGPGCPRMAPLLRHCGPGAFNRSLPWWDGPGPSRS